MFSIRVIEPIHLGDSLTALGRITVGEFREAFEMSLAFWSAEDYRASWLHALKFLETSEDATSCLVSSITDPVNSNFIFCWPLYRGGNDVYIQNAVIFLEDLAEPFDPVRPWLSVRPRAAVDEDGNTISEWRSDMSKMRDFLQEMS